jgi:hypothetical protein
MNQAPSDALANIEAYMPGWLAAGETEDTIIRQVQNVIEAMHPTSNYPSVAMAATPIAEAIMPDGRRISILPGQPIPSGFQSLYPTMPESFAESAMAAGSNGQLNQQQIDYYRSIGVNV